MSKQIANGEVNINIFRTVLSWIIGPLWTGLIASLALITFAFTKSGDTVHMYSRIWSRFLMWIAAIKVEIDGEENIPKDHSVLIVSNHQSLCDILVFSGYLPLRFNWIAKRELFRIPFLGSAMKAAGYIPIDRKNREKVYMSLEHAAMQLKKVSILIFPEGTRTRSGKLGRFKHGVVHLVKFSGVPILPITITNSFERLPPEKRGVVPGTIHVKIDPILKTEGLDKSGLNELMKSLHDHMEERVNVSQRFPG